MQQDANRLANEPRAEVSGAKAGGPKADRVEPTTEVRELPAAAMGQRAMERSGGPTARQGRGQMARDAERKKKGGRRGAEAKGATCRKVAGDPKVAEDRNAAARKGNNDAQPRGIKIGEQMLSGDNDPMGDREIDSAPVESQPKVFAAAVRNRGAICEVAGTKVEVCAPVGRSRAAAKGLNGIPAVHLEQVANTAEAIKQDVPRPKVTNAENHKADVGQAAAATGRRRG